LARSSARENERQKKADRLNLEIGAVPAESCEQLKQNTKNQPRHDRHGFHNGARFEWLLRFAAVTSGWPTTRELTCNGGNRRTHWRYFLMSYTIKC